MSQHSSSSRRSPIGRLFTGRSVHSAEAAVHRRARRRGDGISSESAAPNVAGGSPGRQSNATAEDAPIARWVSAQAEVQLSGSRHGGVSEHTQIWSPETVARAGGSRMSDAGPPPASTSGRSEHRSHLGNVRPEGPEPRHGHVSQHTRIWSPETVARAGGSRMSGAGQSQAPSRVQAGVSNLAPIPENVMPQDSVSQAGGPVPVVVEPRQMQQHNRVSRGGPSNDRARHVGYFEGYLDGYVACQGCVVMPYGLIMANGMGSPYRFLPPGWF